MFCKLCSKHFSNENSFLNHKNSKKHKELEAIRVLSHVANQQIATDNQNETDKKQNSDQVVVKSDRTEKKAQQMEAYLKKHEKLVKEDEAVEEEVVEEGQIDEEDEKNWEDVGEDEQMDQYGKFKNRIKSSISQQLIKL